MAYVTVTKDLFEDKILKCEKTVLLDFWADWCGPCRMIAPHVEDVAREHPEILVGKVDVDREGELAMAYGIESIPTLLVIKNGKVTGKLVGYHTKSEIASIL